MLSPVLGFQDDPELVSGQRGRALNKHFLCFAHLIVRSRTVFPAPSGEDCNSEYLRSQS